MKMFRWLETISDPLYSLLVLAASLLVGALLGLLARWIVGRSTERSDSGLLRSMVERLRGLFVISGPLVGAAISLTASPFPDAGQAVAERVLSILVVIALTWAGVKALYVLEDAVSANVEVDREDNLHARKVTTQIYYIRRVGVVVVIIIGVSVVLGTFEPVQQLGTTLLASAGVAGVVIGIGAQRTVGAIVAGLQVAFTQPIRLDDVLIVENEWGRVEEITLTYVVVRIWDQRRLVLPITYFTERPFQNWTRVTADLLGTVYLYVDYRMPVDPIRAELAGALADSELWDGRVQNVQVTDATEKSMEVRVMVSAKDSPTLWDLRVEIREKLISFLQKEHPDLLPTARVRLGESEDNGAGRDTNDPG
jgi:small-conductance mechanosensitive channel